MDELLQFLVVDFKQVLFPQSELQPSGYGYGLKTIVIEIVDVFDAWVFEGDRLLDRVDRDIGFDECELLLFLCHHLQRTY